MLNCLEKWDAMTELQSVTNLKQLAKKAGISGVQIAEQMGFRPETVSRHLNGKQTISIDDAIKYARILNCSAEEILFKRSMCPIVGDLDKTGNFTSYGEDESKRSYLAGPYNFSPNDAAYFTAGWFSPKKTSIAIFDSKPIAKKYIHDQSVGQISLCQAKIENKIQTVLAYPFENADFETYTLRKLVSVVSAMGKSNETRPLHNTTSKPLKNGIFESVDLIWATPLKAVIYDPPTSGFEIVKDN
jgi:transcriptional regulator with XRE-family HTH domain